MLVETTVDNEHDPTTTSLKVAELVPVKPVIVPVTLRLYVPALASVIVYVDTIQVAGVKVITLES